MSIRPEDNFSDELTALAGDMSEGEARDCVVALAQTHRARAFNTALDMLAHPRTASLAAANVCINLVSSERSDSLRTRLSQQVWSALAEERLSASPTAA